MFRISSSGNEIELASTKAVNEATKIETQPSVGKGIDDSGNGGPGVFGRIRRLFRGK